MNYGHKSLLYTMYSDTEIISVEWILVGLSELIPSNGSKYLYFREDNTIPRVIHCENRNQTFVLISGDEKANNYGIYNSEYIPVENINRIKNDFVKEVNFLSNKKKELDVELDIVSVLEYRTELEEKLKSVNAVLEAYNRKTLAEKLYDDAITKMIELQKKLDSYEKEIAIPIPKISRLSDSNPC